MSDISGMKSVIETPNDEVEINRLAGLSILNYEQQRFEAAKSLNIRASMLDKLVTAKRDEILKRSEDDYADDELLNGIEPHNEPVSGIELADKIYSILIKHVIMPEGGHVAATLWIIASYCINAFRIFPKLCISSPEKRCGKTTLMELLDALVHKGLLCSNISAATIFRAVDAWMPSLLIDEGDTFISGNEELRGIINSGHTRSSAFVLRVVDNGVGHEPKKFGTYSPMAIAMIKTPPDTIIDRSVLIQLRRKMPNESVERLPIEARIEFKPIRRKAKRWANDSFQELIKSKPEVPSIGNDRAEDNWGPLFAIAELIGEGWPEKVREAINHIESSSMNDEAIGPQLLSDIKMIFSESRVDRLFSEELVHKLTDIEESPWCEWKHGKPMTKNSLSRMLGPYNIKSKQIRIGYETKKGYELAQFEDSFARYLAPPVQSETTKQTSNDVGYSVSFQKQKTKQNTNETLQPSNGAGCFDVSLQTPEDVEVF